jgi:hypothetical protein
MKTLFTSLFVPLLCAVLPKGARADVVFTVDLNTTPLVTDLADQPFSLAFQLLQGDPANATNTATIGDFMLGGGSAAPCPSNCTTFGNESGDATSAIHLSTADSFEALIQTFTPGSSLSFTVDLTTHPNSGVAPDAFAFSILDSSLFPIPTQDPTGADSLLSVFINSTNPAILTYATDPTTLTHAGNISLTMGPPTITAAVTTVPEPGSFALLGTALACVGIGALRFRLHGRGARISPTRRSRK